MLWLFHKQDHFPFHLDLTHALKNKNKKKKTHLSIIPVSLFPCFLSFRKQFIYLKMHTSLSTLLRVTLYKLTPTYLNVYFPPNHRTENYVFHQALPLTKSYTSYTCMVSHMFNTLSGPIHFTAEFCTCRKRTLLLCIKEFFKYQSSIGRGP